MMFYIINKQLNKLLKLSFILCLIISSTQLYAKVELPVGRYHQTSDDLIVKVKGGFVTAKRTWYDGQWYFNRAWSTLKFENFSSGTHLVGSYKSITRSGQQYLPPSGSSSYYKFDKRKSIRYIGTGFRWEDRNGNWIEYNMQGVIQKYGDRNNVQVSFQYDTAGKLSGVFDHFGTQVLWYSYYTDGKLQSINDATPITPRKVQYNYTGTELTQVIDIRGNAWTYAYVNGRMSTATDPDGRITNISYQPNGATTAVKKADGTGPTYIYNYDKSKREYYVSITDSSGRVTELWYNKDGDNFRRDINGVTTKKIIKDIKKDTITNELGQVTVRLYDDYENLTKIIYPDNNSVSITYNAKYSNILSITNEKGVVTKVDYDANGNLIRLTQALGKPEQRITELTPNLFGEMEQTRFVGDAVTQDAVYSATYDNNGNVLSYTDPELNKVTNTIFDIMGNTLEWLDARNKLWKSTFDAKGNIRSLTNPLNISERVEYDGFDNIIKYFNEYNKLSEYKYDTSNRLFKVIDPFLSNKKAIYNAKGKINQILDEENKATTFQFDNLNRFQKEIDGNNNAISYSYGDATLGATLSKVSQINYPTYFVQYKYDNRGRVTQAINNYDGLKQVFSIKYDAVGNIIERTAPDGIITRYIYDNLNRKIEIVNAQLKSTKINYDNRDNILSVVNENSITIRTYTYDRNNKTLTVNWPNGSKFSYTYTANGQLESVTDSKNQVAVFIYDDAERQIRKEIYQTPARTTLVKAIDFTYNNSDSLTGYNDGITSASYIYDDLQRRTSETVNYPGFSKTQNYTYFKNDRLKSYKGPDNIEYFYSYDANNLFSSMSVPGEGAITVNQRQWYLPLKTTLPGGATQTNSYDGLMRLKSINNVDIAKNIIQSTNYTYYDNDSIKTRVTKAGTFTYLYDQIDRLTSVTNPAKSTETFSYDFTGNRITSNITTGNWQYDNNNQLQNDTVSSYVYNANGNLDTKTTGTIVERFVYNIEGRLSEIQDTTNATIASYYYDPFGRRLWKEVGTQRTYFMPHEEGIAAEFDSTGSIIQTYGYKPDTAWGTEPLLTKTSAGTFYYHLDHLGAPLALTNKAGAKVWEATYTAFGKASILIEQVSNNLRFPGQYYDAETGLHHNYFRDYDPSTGRYIQSDPIGLGGGLNTYAYALGNPMYWIDPYGLDCHSDEQDVVDEIIEEVVITIILAILPIPGSRVLLAARLALKAKKAKRLAEKLTKAKKLAEKLAKKKKSKRRKNRLPDKGEPNTVSENASKTTRKKYGPDGNVQKEWNKGHTDPKTPKSEQKDHIHDYKPNPRNPSGRGDRMPGRKPRPRDLHDMGAL